MVHWFYLRITFCWRQQIITDAECGIFWWISDNKPLANISADIRDLFVIKSFTVPVFHFFRRHIFMIRKLSEATPAKCQLLILCTQFPDRLCDNKGSVTKMVEPAVRTWCKTSITAVNEPVTSKLLENFWFKWFEWHLLILVPGKCGEGKRDTVTINY